MSKIEIPVELNNTFDAALESLGEPGAWHNGEERARIVQESRNARQCQLCVNRKSALSPYTVSGTHDSGGGLSEFQIELVHRLSTDPGRITRTWAEEVISELGAEAYVEIVEVISVATVADTFKSATGQSYVPVTPKPGTPTHSTNSLATENGAYVRTIDPENPSHRLEGRPSGFPHIITALGLVPDAWDEYHDFWNQLRELTESGDPKAAFGTAQDELVRSKVSALNQCYY